MNNEHATAPEAATVEIQGMSRSAFLLRGAMAAGTVYGLGAVQPFVGNALAKGGDADVLNFALTLEYLEATFYDQASKKVPGLSAEQKRLVRELRDDEMAHVAALKQAVRSVGGKPVASPRFDFGGAFASRDSFLKTANVLEDTGVSAYNGAAPAIRSSAVLAAAGSIVQVEARHAALIRLQRGASPAPRAFDKSSDKAQVLAAVKPFLRM